MSTSLISAFGKNIFSNPFRASCDDGLEVNESRSIAAADTDEFGRKFRLLSTVPCRSSVFYHAVDEYSCEVGSPKYYGLCAFGGGLSCGLTHTAILPLDMVKCRIQVDPAKYGNIFQGFKTTLAEESARVFYRGWAPTLIGYSMQGVGKFGFYEVFKSVYGGILGEENAYLWRTALYLAASASAEFLADIALCPMEAVKVRMQTQPGWSTTLREGFPRIRNEEGITGFYKGLVPLWCRQIPYTMMKFACFERTLEMLYKCVVPKPREDCSKPEQLVVTFTAGYIAGVFCAIISHPADTIVSKLNQAKGSNFMEVAKSLGPVDAQFSCEFGSAKYYGLCAFGGLLSCGLTHTAVVPLDLVKCRIQVDAAKYGNLIKGFKVTLAEEGVRALGKGWAPTLIGYSMQGVGKFGFYEAFKILYSDMLGEENTFLWRTSLYLAASASAEFFADIALCPMEAIKVRIQTQPGWSSTLREGFPRIMQEEGITGFYKGLVPLWCRQIPYTMMKFACFERTVEALYKFVVPKPRAECSKSEQLVVTFTAGYIAGVFCAIVSHPADTIVSKLNNAKGSNVTDIAKELGFAGMWKGLVPRIVMIGTLTALQWFIYDSVKVALRIPRPPPPEMPESLKKKMGIA